MGQDSKIEWTDHTFSPWVGCRKVSPACDHCYAETWATRTGQARLWEGERRRTTASNWRQPLRWNRAAEAAGRRDRVFCASLADVFDNQVPEEWRADLWALIAATPHLDWLLLTKRPQNIAKMLPVMDSRQPGYKPWTERWPWAHVWLGTTVENQGEADRRIPALLEVPARRHFLSCEPLLGPVDLRHLYRYRGGHCDLLDAMTGEWTASISGCVTAETASVDWVIAGGESGPGARPMLPAWARSLRDQCRAAGVPYFFKQWGEWGPGIEGGQMHRFGKARAGRLLDGRTWDEVPA